MRALNFVSLISRITELKLLDGQADGQVDRKIDKYVSNHCYICTNPSHYTVPCKCKSVKWAEKELTSLYDFQTVTVFFRSCSRHSTHPLCMSTSKPYCLYTLPVVQLASSSILAMV